MARRREPVPDRHVEAGRLPRRAGSSRRDAGGIQTAVARRLGGLDYLLFTPFRYTSPYPSRFRRPNEAGIWYGADSNQTVCAETAYWRNRFILDSSGLAKSADGVVTRHTLFEARVAGRALDLMAAPWAAGRADWTDGTNYDVTHAVAADARVCGIEWIRYESVSNPGNHCAAVLSPRALASGKPFDQHEWPALPPGHESS